MSEQRTAPTRIRLSRLQEVQLPDLARLDADVIGELQFKEIQVREPRTAANLAGLTRDHDVLVAEADYVVAGYLAWRDEAPGVAVIDTVAVKPDFQGFGVGSKLLVRLREDARAANLGCAVALVDPKLVELRRLLAKAGFVAVTEEASPVVLAYLDKATKSQPTAQAQAMWLNLNDEA